MLTGVQRSAAGFAVLDASGRFRYVNQAMCDMFGRSVAQMHSLRLADLTHRADLDGHLAVLRSLFNGSTEEAISKRRYVRPDGSDVWVKLISVTIPGAKPQVFLTAVDITDQQQEWSVLAHRAAHDELTGLPARGLFLELLTVATRRLSRRERESVIVGFLDVDGLKQVNDTYGHSIGDELIAAVVARMRNATRPGDVLARVGGDEFTILFDDLNSLDAAYGVADRLTQAMSVPFELTVGPVRVSVSMGLAGASDADVPPEMLVSQADVAMYAAKLRGGNRVEIFDERAYAMRLERQRLENELRAAIDLGELALAYQPIVDLRNGSVRGVEALLRWHHSEHGLLSAADFIEVAEHSGLIIPIGRWVIDEALAQLARWDAELGHSAPGTVYINVSARQLEASDVVGDLMRAMHRTGITADRVCLEITETEALHDPETAALVFRAATELGVDLAIDDFGTGYASLSRLTEIPARTIKLDSSFVKEVRNRRQAAAVISATLLLAHNLRQDVIAEGLEHPADVDAIREMGCEYGQGFYLARPLSPSALCEWITRRLPVAAATGLP